MSCIDALRDSSQQAMAILREGASSTEAVVLAISILEVSGYTDMVTICILELEL